MYKIFLAFKIFLLLITPCFQSYAEQASTLKFSIAAPSSKPFSYKDKAGKSQGFLVDFFSLVERETGIETSITVMPWPRGLNAVKYGKFDALMPTFYRKDRGEYLTFPVESLIDLSSVLLKRSDNDIEISNIADIGNTKFIAKKRAMSIGNEFDEAEKASLINVVEVKTLEQAIQMLMHLRVDLVASHKFVSLFVLKNLKLIDKVDVIKISNNETPSYLAFSKSFSKKHDVNKIMKSINQVKGLPEYQALVDKYLK